MMLSHFSEEIKVRKKAFLQIRVHATRLQRRTRLQTQLAIKKVLIFIYAIEF